MKKKLIAFITHPIWCYSPTKIAKLVKQDWDGMSKVAELEVALVALKVEVEQAKADRNKAALKERQKFTPLLNQLEKEKAALASVMATSVEALVKRYLELLKRLNDKDKPDGFDSWEDYHKHIVNLRKLEFEKHKLIQHAFIHSNYPHCGFMQMTTEQKKLFLSIIGPDHPETVKQLSQFVAAE